MTPDTTAQRTFNNDRGGRTITTSASNEELLAAYAQTAPPGHWLWYWLADWHQRQAQAAPAGLEMREFLADSFLLAIGMGLKRPQIRLKHGDWRYKVYLSARGTVCFKVGALAPGTNDPDGNEDYMGCLAGGSWRVSDRRKMWPANVAFMEALEADPVGFMARCSKDVSACCYCNQPLEDPRSKQAGYGETCAGRWGLPWGKAYDDKVPTFAQCWAGAVPQLRRDLRAICRGLRQDPTDALGWAAFADALEEAGLPHRPAMPGRAVRVPAA